MANWIGQSLWALAFAAAVTAMPVESKAADSEIKLPEAVVAQCRTDAMTAIAGLKAKVDANPSPQATALLEKSIKRRIDNCLETAGLQVQLNDVKVQYAEAKAQRADVVSVWNNLKEINSQLEEITTFFREFVNGKKTKAEYDAKIAYLQNFVESSMEKIAFTRKVHANDPVMLASTDRLENGIKQMVAMYSPIRTAAK